MLREAARALAAEDQDRARDLNDRGYSQADTYFGHELAEMPADDWTPAVSRAAWEMLAKYAVQLSDHGIDFDAIPVPADPGEEATRNGRRALVGARRDRREGERQAERERLRAEEIERGRVITWIQGVGFQIRFPPFGQHFRDDLVTVRALPRRRFVQGDDPHWSALDSAENHRGITALIQEHGFGAEQPVLDRLGALAEAAGALADVPARRIELSDEHGLVFHFPYHPPTFNTLRALPGFGRHPADPQLWCAPATPAVYGRLQELIDDHGFVADPGIGDRVNELQEEAQLLEVAATRVDVEFPIPGLSDAIAPHQRSAAAYATVARRCLFADDMGTGNREAALAALQASRAYPAVIMAPSAGVGAWEKSITELLPDMGRVQVIRGDVGRLDDGVDIFIVTYRSLGVNLDRLRRVKPAAVVADTADVFASRKSKRRKAGLELAGPAEARLGILPNIWGRKPEEVLGALEVTGIIDHFGGYWPFVHRYCEVERGPFGPAIVGWAEGHDLEGDLRKVGLIRRDTEDLLRAGSRAQARATAALGGQGGEEHERRVPDGRRPRTPR